MTEPEILRGLQHREAWAWQAVRDRYIPSLWRYVHSQLSGQVDTVEDVVAETMLALVRAVDDLDVDTFRIGGWLRRVAKNKVVDHHRAAARVRRLLTHAQQTQVAENGHNGMSELLARETQAQVRDVMDQLPDRSRDVLEWKYLDGLSVREIACRMGQSEKSIESILFRARRDFRGRYAGFDTSTTKVTDAADGRERVATALPRPRKSS